MYSVKYFLGYIIVAKEGVRRVKICVCYIVWELEVVLFVGS